MKTTSLNTYEIQFEQLNSNTPYIPFQTPYAQQLDLWKKYLAPLLLNCGFYHIGDMKVLGSSENMIEFLLQHKIPKELSDAYNNNIQIKIKQISNK